MTLPAKPSLAIELISGFFILLFVYTALSKFNNLDRFAATLAQSPLLGAASGFFAPAIPVIELLVATLLFVPSRRYWGLVSAASLMALFTGYIGYMLLFSPRLPCSCGGIINGLSWKGHLLYNTGATALALMGWKWERNKKTDDKQAIVNYSC